MEWHLQNITHSLITFLGIEGSRVVFGNTIEQYLFTVSSFFVYLALFYIIQKVTLSWLSVISKKTKTDFDDIFVKIVLSFRPPFYLLLAFWISLRVLETSTVVDGVVTALLVLWGIYQAVVIMGIVVEDIIFRHFAKDTDETTKSAIHLLTNLAKGVVWVLGLLLVLSNFGIDITSLVAGAGIAGIAIAFALQGILSDLFSSFSLYFDKPFRVGDFIKTGDVFGVVKHIGVKSTRIESLAGEEIVISNQELTSARIQNYKIMEERRVAFTFGVLYSTDVDLLKKIPDMVRGIVTSLEGVRFDRAHLKGLADSALEFEVVYYVNNPDYTVYMDAQQSILLALLTACKEEGIGFAFPTRTVHIEKA